MLILNLDSQLQKHTVKMDMAIPGNQMIGLPATGQMIIQLQLLGGLARELTRPGWHQSNWILPTIRHTLFWILAVHVRLDQKRQSKGSRNMHGITALRQSFAVAISPSCLPTLRRRLVGKIVIHFPTTPPCSTRVDVLETGDVPILFSLSQMKNLAMTIDMDPNRDKSTLLQLNTLPRDMVFWT